MTYVLVIEVELNVGGLEGGLEVGGGGGGEGGGEGGVDGVVKLPEDEVITGVEDEGVTVDVGVKLLLGRLSEGVFTPNGAGMVGGGAEGGGLEVGGPAA